MSINGSRMLDNAMCDRTTAAGWAMLPLVLLITMVAPGLAAELRQLRLTDGSVITGEIESVRDGVYTVRSPSLGTITVKDADIRSIAAPNAAAAPADTTNAPSAAGALPQLDTTQRRILEDDGIMSAVTALQDDPQLQDILNDPEVMEALQSGNLEALQSNSKVRSLMNDPRVQDITKKVAQ